MSNGETHDDRCCMNGVPAGSDPQADCPGAKGECTWCRMCGSCDAGLPMSCTCGPCTCTEPCGHPRCGDAGEPEVEILDVKTEEGAARWQGLQPPIVIYDEMADFTTPWPRPPEVTRDQASWALPGKSIAPHLEELIQAARKRGLTEMEAEADQGWPGQAGDDPESEG